MINGMCVTESVSEVDCKRFSGIKIRGATWGGMISYPTVPAGCIIYNNKVYYNKLSTSIFCSRNYQCVCKKGKLLVQLSPNSYFFCLYRYVA